MKKAFTPVELPYTFSYSVWLAPAEGRIFEIEGLREAGSEFCRKLSLKVVKEVGHEFAPHGMTLALVLSQSHLILHTWPEIGVVRLDLLSCVEGLRAEAVDAAARELGKSRIIRKNDEAV